MTVKELCSVLRNPRDVNLSADGFCYPVMRDGEKEYDFVMMAAFGGCKVRNLISCTNKDGCFEIALEVDLVKEAQA